MNNQTIQSNFFLNLSENQSKPSTVKKVTILFALLLFAFSAKGQLVYESTSWITTLSLNGPRLPNRPYPYQYIDYSTTWHGQSHAWLCKMFGDGPDLRDWARLEIFFNGYGVLLGSNKSNIEFCIYNDNGTVFHNNLFAANYYSYGNYYTISDMNAKTNIVPLTSALKTILALKPVTYQWKDNSMNRAVRVAPNPKEFGFLAQDLEKIIPDIVAVHEDKKLVNYQAIIPILTAAIQELTVRIEELEQQLKSK